jgi:aerobic carbon-monoxide dehydrogenase medium subunit
MYAFELVRPKSLADASTALTQSGGKALAGGQSLLAAMKLRLAQPGTLVDLSALPELRGISRQGKTIKIGAFTTHTEVAESDVVAAAIPALAALAHGIGDRQIRNVGTLGGSIAHNDPAACYPAAILALDATIETTTRTIKADDFFTGMFETALVPGEIIVSVSFPIPKQAAYVKFPSPASGFLLVGVFVADTSGGVRVAVTGAASAVFRCAELEKSLGKSFTPETAKATTVASSGLNSDLHGSPEYRAHLIPVLAARAVAAAGPAH